MTRTLSVGVALAVVVSALGAGNAAAADDVSAVLKNRTIGYVLADRRWSVLQSAEGKTECPDGFNLGPREQFKLLFPEDGTKRTMMETVLAREGEVWHPTLTPEPYPFHEAKGPLAIGLNLDGKIDANDFVSPEGEKGIDNQLFRAIGCISNYRGPEGTIYHFENKFMQQFTYNRIMIELTNVDSLTDDNDVTVTTYRGLDDLLTGSTGEPESGGSQRVDLRWGRIFIQNFRGKIANGILTTDAADFTFPWTGQPADNTPLQPIRDMRFQLKLSPNSAEGLLGGYVDIKTFYLNLNENWSTHHQSYGQESSPSLYRALNRVADAYPDPATGRNTAVSTSISVKWKQVFIVHPPAVVAEGPAKPDAETAGMRAAQER
jgi:hypothetical protein